MRKSIQVVLCLSSLAVTSASAQDPVPVYAGLPPTIQAEIRPSQDSGLAGANTESFLYDVEHDRYPEITGVFNTYRPVTHKLPGGEVTTRYVQESRTLSLQDFDEKKLKEMNPEDRRSTVQTVTGLRHPILMRTLKQTDDEEAKKKILEKLKENYQSFYAAETDYRQGKLKELQERLDGMKSKLDDRIANEKEFLDAAMKLAELAGKGLNVEPPALTTGSPEQFRASSGVQAPRQLFRGPASAPTPSTTRTPFRKTYIPSTRPNGEPRESSPFGRPTDQSHGLSSFGKAPEANNRLQDRQP